MANTQNYGFNLISYKDDVVPDKMNENFVILDTALKSWLADIEKRIDDQGYREYSARMNALEVELGDVSLRVSNAFKNKWKSCEV